MLSINKIYGWLFVIALLIQIPSISLLKSLDELLVLFMAGVVFLDVTINGSWAKYKTLWIITGIMVFYAIYSLIFLSYNTANAIAMDFVIQLKPFCYFCISYAIAPRFGAKTKTLLKCICIINIIIVGLCFCIGATAIKSVFTHVTYLGLVSTLSFLVYLTCSTDDEGKISKKDIIIAIIILTIGLTSTRSKFYGEYVFALYMLFLYSPGIMKRFKFKHSIILITTLVVILWVAWSKIDYYFISGGQEEMLFDEDLMQTFARPVLYTGMWVILMMHPIFGSGLGSFATYASSKSVSYAQTYSAIGIDNVWGLSEDYGAFICDAFYPELAQFGFIGVTLFIYFFIWLTKKISLNLRVTGKGPYLIGMITIAVLLIENIASTTFNQGAGAMCMMILGCVTSKFRRITKEEQHRIMSLPYKETKSMEYIK